MSKYQISEQLSRELVKLGVFADQAVELNDGLKSLAIGETFSSEVWGELKRESESGYMRQGYGLLIDPHIYVLEGKVVFISGEHDGLGIRVYPLQLATVFKQNLVENPEPGVAYPAYVEVPADEA